jgi:hypothetical protein
MTPDGAVRIEGNRITVESPNSYGIVVGRYGDDEYRPTGATVQDHSILVRDNAIQVNGAPNADNAALACCGGCSDAEFKFNVVTGSARYGLRVSRLEVPIMATSSAHPVRTAAIANNLQSFTAQRAQVHIGELVQDTNVHENVFGSVAGSNDTNWLQEPHAGIACFGHDGQVMRNDFSGSGISGWHRGPPTEPPAGSPQKPQPFAEPGIGCIYLAESSSSNDVEYELADFPAGTVPPPGNQILDVFRSGWASVVKKMELHENRIHELAPH